MGAKGGRGARPIAGQDIGAGLVVEKPKIAAGRGRRGFGHHGLNVSLFITTSTARRRRRTPSEISAGVELAKQSRIALPGPPGSTKAEPGMKATPASKATGNRASVDRPPGSSTQTKNPPSGVVQLVPCSPANEPDRAVSMASRRKR